MSVFALLATPHVPPQHVDVASLEVTTHVIAPAEQQKHHVASSGPQAGRTKGDLFQSS